MDDTHHKLATEWVKLSYYLPITWEQYIKAPLHIKYAWFSELAEIRKSMSGGGYTGSPGGDRKAGLE